MPQKVWHFYLEMHQKSYIIEGFRIPTGKKGGYYKNIIPEVYTAHILKHFREKYPFLDTKLDELILGVSIGTGGNMARFALLEAGFDKNIPATTIDFQCGSSLRAVAMADSQLKAGQSDCILVGGMESNSLAPKRQYNERDFRFKNADEYYSQATFAPESYGESSLIKAAENVAIDYLISKKEMLQWTLKSHWKAREASENQDFTDIIIPFQNHKIDQTIRKNIFSLDIEKTYRDTLIDHTNTAHLHDGASVLMMATESFCKKNNIQPRFEILSTAWAGGEPSKAPLGIVWATEKLLTMYHFPLKKIDLFEINESFALKPLVFIKQFGIEAKKVNIFGGNLAFGHPFGASGAINLLHLMKALELSNKKIGLVSMGVAGGLGISMLIKKIS